MAFLFNRNKQRSNMDLVRSTKEALQRLAAEEKPQPKTEEDLSRNLTQMKIVLQGTPGEPPSRERARSVYKADFREQKRK